MNKSEHREYAGELRELSKAVAEVSRLLLGEWHADPELVEGGRVLARLFREGSEAMTEQAMLHDLEGEWIGPRRPVGQAAAVERGDGQSDDPLAAAGGVP